MESRLLSDQQREELINTESMADAVHKLEERGWQHPDFSSREAMDKCLEEARSESFREIAAFAPDKSMVNVFRLRYDYHNIKTLLKAGSLEKSSDGVLSDCGIVSLDKMTSAMHEENYSVFSPAMRHAVENAREILGRTQDFLSADIALDRACFAEMTQMAKNSGSDFLLAYVKLQIDAVNLRTAVRINRRGLGYEYLRTAFIDGGSVEISKLLSELTPEVLEAAYETTGLLGAAKVGGAVLRGEERLSALDMACDNALMAYLRTAKYIGLGEQPLVAYMAAREEELTAVRVIFSGKLSGLSPAEIRERLRESYV